MLHVGAPVLALPPPMLQPEIWRFTSCEPHFGQATSPSAAPIFCSLENNSPHASHRYS
jgi:hypothetical protein